MTTSPALIIRHRIVALAGAITLLLSATSTIALAQPRECTWRDDVRPRMIALIGDIQRTSDAEAIFLSRRQNDRERTAILDAVLNDKPDMLLLLGDQVSSGESESEWEFFDRALDKINDAKIPVRAVYGNHDYEGDKNMCLRNFNRRFPYQPPLGFDVVRLGSLALITINTNFDKLSDHDRRKQKEDFAKALAELDKDNSVVGVIVAGHHPPYSNSELGANDEVITTFAEPFCRARKTRLFLSGHVHNYERFAVGDKTFLVTGGGGGPLRTVNTSSSRLFQNDAYRREQAVRPFHYVRLKVTDSALIAETRFYRKGKFVTDDQFTIGLYPDPDFAPPPPTPQFTDTANK